MMAESDFRQIENRKSKHAYAKPILFLNTDDKILVAEIVSFVFCRLSKHGNL